MNVEVQNLQKRYGQAFSLHIPSLHIASGESFGLVGNNGAGKTTFLRLVLDLIRADQGRVLIDGRDVALHTDWRQHTGSYLDESFLLDFLTPDEYFNFAGSIYGLSKEDVQQALDPYRSFYTDEAIGRTTKYIRDLSKGNIKKVGLVAAMFIQPRFLVLDEPFANLDPGSQIKLKKLIMHLNRAHGTTLFISSHDLGHITEVCERITVVERGRLVQDITTSEATLRDLELYFANRLE